MLGWGSMCSIMSSSMYRSSRSDGLAFAVGRHGAIDRFAFNSRSVGPLEKIYLQF